MRARALAHGLLCVIGFGCTKHDGAPYSASTPAVDPSGAPGAQSIVPPVASTPPPPPPPKPGMAWIPAGVLKAGTPPDRTPRIPDEELPGTELSMGGYYIDLYPYPNEVGAIPTVNVTRDEAAKSCAAAGKRLCTEFEWERACKGPDNVTYEYGETYRAAACGTGVTVEHAARRPNGEHVACKSGFGVHELHGSVWEWTDSPWRRGSSSPDLGVLRGGNSRAGELVGRCANAIGRKASTKSATMGFRCCAGPRNPLENELVVAPSTVLERSHKPQELAAPFVAAAAKAWGEAHGVDVRDPEAFTVRQAYTWHPVANEELVLLAGCVRPESEEKSSVSRCGLAVVRVRSSEVVVTLDSGRGAAEVVQFGESRRLRMRGLDLKGSFVREIVYAYGRVEVGELRR